MNNLKYSRSKHFDLEQISDGVFAAIAIRGTETICVLCMNGKRPF